MKKLFIFIIVFMLAFSLVWIYIFYPREKVKVFIPEKSSAITIAKILKENGVIFSSFYFKTLVKITKTDKKINPGEYVFRKYTPPELVLYRMINQRYLNSVKIVIPEGWRSEQIAQRLYKNGVIKNEKRFLDIVKKEKLEGYLFPSTYYLSKNMNEEDVIRVFKETFEKNVRPLFLKYKIPPELNNEYNVIILASIVEREAVFDEERPLIAAVYINRLRKKMPLEADPTVQYVIGYWKKGLTYKDLEIPSPYNTYYVSGLPPTPICSPGKKSIEAVLNPAGIEALYFVADNTGKHIFNVKFNEHLKAKERVKRKD